MKLQIIPNVKTLIVIPCLNEARTIDDLLLKFSSTLNNPADRIIVADGGSTDGTRDIVADFSRQDPRVILLANPKRIQSAGINLAVEMFGKDYDYLIRIDAHGDYPDDYCHRLLEDAVKTGADSVVVAMDTVGHGTFQKATAVAQNSKLGNGGSKHREGAKGHWIDHGHHALMRISAFTAVGGYDESFSHNEDAELDYRLRKAGFRIWMTDKTRMTYYPRANVTPLFKQYLAYGRGRAKNLLKHRSLPKIRQMIPLSVMPIALFALLGVFHWVALIPLCLWIAACLGYGLWMAIAQKNSYGPLAALSAMVMHFAWSTGFWLELLTARGAPSLVTRKAVS
ncbi:glycosyltransferase family 2 protein [Agrobacterium sp. rho-13.3]|uniref:glycosyltransferase family 2 protein n=1 Tax=Agrobacterium sp. rho-13.3 TaxID=3072980 RepID=UPI002A164B7D|nr:glycosyltransferase family 2 protein [Agrobacterium sp. rho-13.3]MDX8306389.1 glycosyltransferase family 2 protein [Agrobacterium sp. rho-13.3]MDX8307280.1 glycosyltransferase family 2 protein [Agrobacterium sp. rho-13.3]